MADNSNNNGTGGMMKKLLFPASSSGANDTFRGQGADDTPSGNDYPMSPPVSQQHQQTPNAHHVNHSQMLMNSHHRNNNKESNKQAAPPRFFSSTHPSSSAHYSLENNKQQQQPLQTPARVPSSPPLLNRQPVTPSLEMDSKTAAATGGHNQHGHKPTGTQRRLFAQISQTQVPLAPSSTRQPHEDEKEHESPLQNNAHDDTTRSPRGRNKNAHHNQPVLNNGEDDLQFLKDFKSKQQKQQQRQPKIMAGDLYAADDDDDVEEAPTEVHANTTAKQYRNQQAHQEVLIAAAKRHLHVKKIDEEKASAGSKDDGAALPDKSDQEVDEVKQHLDDKKDSTAATPANYKEANNNDTDLGEEEDGETDNNKSIHEGIQSYPSYYDNPYHNPMASAMKPNDLFRKDHSLDHSSDINSNASEMGTVIGAPMSLMAERFAEVDEMEREGKRAMQQDQDQTEDDQNLSFPEHQHHQQHTDHDDNILDDIYDEEFDPANYKAFRVNDDDDEEEDQTNIDENDLSLFNHDPFQTPSSDPTAASKFDKEERANSMREVAANVFPDDEVGSGVGQDFGEPFFDDKTSSSQPTSQNVQEQSTANIRKQGEGPIQSETFQVSTDTHSSESMPMSQGSSLDMRTKASSPRDEAYDCDDAALSEVDSEIDQLVRQSASENSGEGRVKSFSSNNSSEVFRTSSIGSAPDVKPKKSTQPNNKELHPRKEILDYAKGTLSEDDGDMGARQLRPSSSLKKALTQAQQQEQDAEDNSCHQPDHGQKEEEKKEKEEDLLEQTKQQLALQQQYRFEVPEDVDDEDNPLSEVHTAANASDFASVGGPGKDLAGTLHRIGARLDVRPTPTTNQQFFFDIDDEDDDDEDNGDNHNIETHNDHREEGSLSAPSSPGGRFDHHSLSRTQKTFPPLSPGQPSISQMHHSKAPDSFLLRSPGSSARLMADYRRESSSSSLGGDNQRPSAWNGRVPSMLHTASFPVGNNGPTPRARGDGQNHQHKTGFISPGRTGFKSPGRNAFRFARGCLSFDTTADNHYDYDDQEPPSLRGAASYDNHRLESAVSYDDRHRHRNNTKTETASAFRPGSRTQALYGSSRSWDINSGVLSSIAGISEPITEENVDEKPGPAAVTLDASAFRVAPYVRLHQQHQHPHAHGYNNSHGGKLLSGERRERLNLMSDTMMKRQLTNEELEVLQTPQRIEIEREDALNLLSMLCERGVALDGESKKGVDDESEEGQGKLEAKTTITGDEDTGLAAHKGGAKLDGQRATQLEAEVIDAAVETIRDISSQHTETDSIEAIKDSTLPRPDHKVRMQVLDELLRSHTYAHEMKRAALSASAWLRSIGHTDANKGGLDAMGDLHVGEDGSQAAGEGAGGEKCPVVPEDAKSEAVEVQALKAMLHQAQMEAREKEAAAQQLNEELSKCRAEIGRLKSASRSSKTSFTSPNRSILDDEEESTTSAAEGGESAPRNEFEDNIADQSAVDLDSSLFANEDGAEVVRESDQPVVRELAMFKSALSDANAIIKQLHSELREAKPDSDDTPKKAPLIEVSQKAFSVALVDDSNSNLEQSPNNSDRHSDNRMVNVRMLDAENFVTDWDHLESLPPPPDHGLRSPIVSVLLRQWSPDEGLHESLLAWMDRAMAGTDPSTIPPLTLSSLDHQVRDGFTMHVLPLLLRRSDILVDVKTRAHRKTTYDVAISVKRNASRYQSRNAAFASASDSASMVDSVTASAVTTHIRNGDAAGRETYDVGSTAASYTGGSNYSTLLPHRPSDETSEQHPQQQAGIMSALGGALGGLLSRRKPISRSYDAGIAANSSYDMGSAAGAAGSAMDHNITSPSSVGEHVDGAEAPFHRMVSAPPGRIGVSFVEYRGHAMVSDVSEDSPLLGWIFPSDILIAIDEKAVAGMRLKEIVKVLQGRNDRQRALRVISSRAMNEFTMNVGTPTLPYI